MPRKRIENVRRIGHHHVAAYRESGQTEPSGSAAHNMPIISLLYLERRSVSGKMHMLPRKQGIQSLGSGCRPAATGTAHCFCFVSTETMLSSFLVVRIARCVGLLVQRLLLYQPRHRSRGTLAALIRTSPLLTIPTTSFSQPLFFDLRDAR